MPEPATQRPTGLDQLEGPADWWSERVPLGPPGPFRHPLRWLLLGTLIYLAFAIPTAREVLTGGHPAWWNTLVVLLAAGYGGCYLVFPMFLPKQSLAVKLAFCAGMLAMGWTLLVLLGFGAVFLLIYATAVVAFTLPPGWVVVLDGTCVLTLVVLTAADGRWSEDIGDVITVGSVTLTLYFIGRLTRALRRLRAATDEIATLAVTAERERLARDLHDLLGHSLTTITVKAGLARRIMERSGGPEQAIAEVHEVEGLARRALADVRATVSEYREVSLSAELVGARAALRAAEIEADLPHAVDNVRPELHGVFGYVLREAVTNVLRHTKASRVQVRFGPDWIDIENDGDPVPTPAEGNGLRGLSERVRAAGGTLTAAPRPGGGFRVHATGTAA